MSSSAGARRPQELSEPLIAVLPLVQERPRARVKPQARVCCRCGGRNLATASAHAGPPGPSFTGVGWPGGESPADELWARVDAELSTAGASSREPKLTKDSPSEEIWGRVEDELGGPPQWKPRVVIPSADETVSAERDPAEEAAGQAAWAESAVWAEPAAWAERPGWPDGADHAEPLVVIGREDTDPADRAGTAQASTAPAQDTNGAQHVAPAATAAAGATPRRTAGASSLP